MELQVYTDDVSCNHILLVPMQDMGIKNMK